MFVNSHDPISRRGTQSAALHLKVVAEPTTLALLILGLAGLGWMRLSLRHKSSRCGKVSKWRNKLTELASSLRRLQYNSTLCFIALMQWKKTVQALIIKAYTQTILAYELNDQLLPVSKMARRSA